MFDINHVSDDPQLDHLLGRTIVPIDMVCIHLRNPSGFVDKWGKKIKAAGGRYSDCRGYQSERYVHIPWDATGRKLLDAICTAHPSPRQVFVVDPLFSTFRGISVRTCKVCYVNTTAGSASERIWAQYCDAFVREFPDVVEDKPLTGIEGTVAYYVPAGLAAASTGNWPTNTAPRMVRVGMRNDNDTYHCREQGNNVWGVTNVHRDRLFTSASDAWLEIRRQYEELAEKCLAAAAGAAAGAVAAAAG